MRTSPSAPDPGVEIDRADLRSADAAGLIAALNAELSAIYPEAGATHFRLDPDEVGEGRGAFVIARVAGVPVGCGAIRRLDADNAEIKRMYVVPAQRGRGISRRVLERLETEARGLGVRKERTCGACVLSRNRDSSKATLR